MNEHSQPPGLSDEAQEAMDLFELFCCPDTPPPSAGGAGDEDLPSRAMEPEKPVVDTSVQSQVLSTKPCTKPKAPKDKYPNNDLTAGPNYQNRETQTFQYNTQLGFGDFQYTDFAIEHIVNKTVDQLLDNNLTDSHIYHRLNPNQVDSFMRFIESLQPVNSKIMESTYLGDPGWFLTTLDGCRYHFWHRMRLAEEAKKNGGNPTTLFVPASLTFKPYVCVEKDTMLEYESMVANYQCLYHRWFVSDFLKRRVEAVRFQKLFCVPGTLDFTPDIVALIESKRDAGANPVQQNLHDPRVAADLDHNWPPSKKWPDNILSFDAATTCRQAGIARQTPLNASTYPVLGDDLIYPVCLRKPWVYLRNPLEAPIVPFVNPRALHDFNHSTPRYTSEEVHKIKTHTYSNLDRLRSFISNRMKLNPMSHLWKNRDLIGFDDQNDEWNRKELGADERLGKFDEHRQKQLSRERREEKKLGLPPLKVSPKQEQDEEDLLNTFDEFIDYTTQGWFNPAGKHAPLPLEKEDKDEELDAFIAAVRNESVRNEGARDESTSRDEATARDKAAEAQEQRFLALKDDMDNCEYQFRSTVHRIRKGQRG